MVTTTSAARTVSSVQGLGNSRAMSIPTSAIACTADELISPAGCEPPDRATAWSPARWLKYPRAIWERPALWVQRNSTTGLARIVSPGYSATTRPTPMSAPRICAAMKPGVDPGAIPAKLSENIRPTVTAGLAKDVELVNQYAAPMYAATAAADSAARPLRARAKTSAISPAVATTSPTRWPEVTRFLVAISTSCLSN